MHAMIIKIADHTSGFSWLNFAMEPVRLGLAVCLAVQAIFIFPVSGFTTSIFPRFTPSSISRVTARRFDGRLRGPAMMSSAPGSENDGEQEPPRRMEGDWRAFRNKLIQSQQSSGPNKSGSDEASPSSNSSSSKSTTAAAGSSSSSWAHELVAAENGCVLLSNMEHHFGQRYFESAVITLIEHGENGTVGMITNRPMTQTVGEVAPQLYEFRDCPLFFGGPVGEGVQVLHRVGGIRGSRQVVAGLYYGADMDHATEAVRKGLCKPSDFRFFYKYSAWSPGQLDDELGNSIWFPAACSPDLALPSARPALIHTRTIDEEWRNILRLLGGNYTVLSERARMLLELKRGAKVDRWAEMVRSGEIEAGAMLLSMGGGSQETVTEWLDGRAKEVKELLGVPVDQVELPEILGGKTGSLPVLEAMKRAIFDVEDGGLSGDNQDYYNPDNSRIDRVIARGKGNPITLCAVYMAVGRRLGLTFEGINAPAHFMCRLPGAGLNGEDAYVDAFRGGGIMTEGEARQMIVDLLTRGELEPSAMDKALIMQDPAAILKAASTPVIWSRMAHNLVRALLRAGDGDAAMEINESLDHLEEACQRVLHEVGGSTISDL